jgi:hypothetical protein
MGKALAVAWSNRESHDATDVVSEDRARTELGRGGRGVEYASRKENFINHSVPTARDAEEGGLLPSHKHEDDNSNG